MGKRLTYVLSGCMLLIMWAESGCTKQSLDHRKREGHVHIALQWDKGYTPAGSRFYFYPEDGSEAIVRDCPKEGFSGTLPEGSYRVIVLNSDAWNIALRNEQQHQTAEIYVLPEEEGLSAVPCICQPGNLLLAGGINEADKLEVPYRDTVSVSASPHSRVKKIRFFFKLENFVPVVLCSGRFPEFPRRSFALPVPVRTLRQTFVSPFRQPRGSTISRPMSLFLIWRVPKKPAELICWI